MSIRTLEDICTTFKSNILINQLDGNDGDYPLFGAKGVIKGISSYQMEEPYISVIKWGAGVGRADIRPAFTSIVATMLGIVPKEGIDIHWLCYLLQTMHLEQYATNAVVPNLYFKDYCKTAVSVPSITEQKRIAEQLHRIQVIQGARRKELQMFDNLVKARFVEMFENGNYQIEKLGAVCNKITDGTHKTPTYLDDGITFISAKNIVSGELDFTDVKHISEDEYQEIQKRCQTAIYDILLSKSGSLGAPAIVKTEEKLGLFESLAVLKYDRGRLLPEFLCEQLKTDRIQRQFTTGTKGVAIKHLHLGVIADTDIIVPPLDEQKTFSAFVSQIDKSKFVEIIVFSKAFLEVISKECSR